MTNFFSFHFNCFSGFHVSIAYLVKFCGKHQKENVGHFSFSILVACFFFYCTKQIYFKGTPPPSGVSKTQICPTSSSWTSRDPKVKNLQKVFPPQIHRFHPFELKFLLWVDGPNRGGRFFFSKIPNTSGWSEILSTWQYL